jgi:hypothetical protein
MHPQKVNMESSESSALTYSLALTLQIPAEMGTRVDGNLSHTSSQQHDTGSSSRQHIMNAANEPDAAADDDDQLVLQSLNTSRCDEGGVSVLGLLDPSCGVIHACEPGACKVWVACSRTGKSHSVSH